MSIAQTNTIAKVAAVIAGLGLVAMTFAAAAPAKAADTFMMDLTVGSRGADVTALQSWLIAQGFSIPAGATGYFGMQTKAAVAAYQAKNGITPAVGYFGPKTRASVNAMGGNQGGGPVVGNGELKGAGRLTNVDQAGDVESDLDEGDTGVKVVGLEADAEDGDVALQRLDVEFDLSSGTSKQLKKYIQSATVWLDGKKLATMDAEDADKDGNVWTMRFNNLKGVIKDGDTGQIYVSVDTVDSIDSSEDGDDVTVTIPQDGLRAVSADGVSETYVDSDFDETFNVSAATTGKLTISEGSDNPKATTVKAEEDSNTDDVTLLSFTVKAKEQDVTIHDLPVTVTANASSLADYVQTVKLVKNGKTIKSKTATSTSATQTFVFNDIDETISKDDTETYDVVVNVREIDNGGSNTFASGDYLYASVSNTGWDTEDEEGDSATISGSLTGNNITFQSTGITVTKVDATASKTVGTTASSGDSTQYSIAFKVTAGDDDIYLSRTITRLASTSASVSTSNGVQWATTSSSSNGTASASTTLGTASLAANDTNNSDTTSVYKVPSGTSRTFTLNVTINEVAGTLYTGVQLVGFAYGTTSTMDQTYTSGLDTFKTADVSMTTH